MKYLLAISLFCSLNSSAQSKKYLMWMVSVDSFCIANHDTIDLITPVSPGPSFSFKHTGSRTEIFSGSIPVAIVLYSADEKLISTLNQPILDSVDRCWQRVKRYFSVNDFPTKFGNWGSHEHTQHYTAFYYNPPTK